MSEENKINEIEEQSESVQTDDKKEESKEKKMSRKERLNAELQGLSMKERKKVLEERKEKRRRNWYIGIGAVIAVLVVALLFWDSGVLQRNMTALKVGEKSYTAAELDYYFYSNYNNYSSYASYYGLDTQKSLKEQEIYKGTSWYDYFRDNAKSAITNVAVLNQEAEKAKFTLSEDGKKTVEKNIQELKDHCKENGYSVSYYLKATFGEYMNLSTFKKVLSDSQLAQEYEKTKKESFKQTDKAVKDYYKKHSAELDTFEYQAYQVPVDTGTETDKDGKTKKPTEKELKAARKKAKEGAVALNKALTEQDDKTVTKLVEKYGATDYSNQGYDSFSNLEFSDWLTDENRQTGDVTTVKNETEESKGKKTLNGYYVVRFDQRYLDKYHNANFRNILVPAKKEDENHEDADAEQTEEQTKADYAAAEKKAKKLQAQWKKKGADEDAFAKLAETESADENSKDKGGLYENMSKTDVGEELLNWLFGEKRKAGDFTILKDESSSGYQLLYFQSYNKKLHWQDASVSALQSEAYGKWYDKVKKNYKDSTTFMYRYV